MKKLQAEFGFKPDGVIGGDTLDALNAGPGYRARQLAIAMERLRWLPRDPPDDADRRQHRRRVPRLLARRPARRPPQGRRRRSRQADAAAPGADRPAGRQADLDRARRASARRSSRTRARPGSPTTISSMKDGLYVQQSGPKNSLGLVKFDMDDKEAIYLHDTPAKALFGMPERHRSHGCVRVENAVAVRDRARRAGRRARPVPAGDAARTTRPSSSCRTQIPVRLLYQTAFWDGSSVQFRPTFMAGTTMSRRRSGSSRARRCKIEQPESSDDIGP